MKIVDVNPFFYPYVGGIENRIHQTSTMLAEKGHDVTVLTGRLPNTLEEEIMPEGYRVIRLKSKYVNLYNPPYIKSYNILDTLQSLDADVVNYNYRWSPSYNNALDKYDGKKIHTVHNTWCEGRGLAGVVSAANDYLFWNKMMRYDRIVTVSDDIRNDLIRRGAPADKITMIPTCGAVKKFEKKEEKDFILSIGRLVDVKGIKYLIDAMKQVDCKLVICGKGPEEKHIKKQIIKLGLQNKIDFRGYVSEEEKTELMATCKMIVMPSLFEAFGMVAVEGMSHSKPIVCTNVNGLPETVGEGGIHVEPKNSKELSEAINTLLDDDGLRKELGMKALEQAISFDWSNHIDDYEKLLIETAHS